MEVKVLSYYLKTHISFAVDVTQAFIVSMIHNKLHVIRTHFLFSKPGQYPKEKVGVTGATDICVYYKLLLAEA